VTPTIDPAAVEARFDTVEQAVSKERRRVVDEREALQTFTQRVRDSETAQPTPGDSEPAVALSTGGSSATLATVRQAYEATFMSVSHYEEDYGEAYAQSIAAEFGPDIAVALCSGAHLTRAHKQALLGAVDSAVQRRELLADVLGDEQDSLTEARETLCPLTEELAEIRHSLEANRAVGLLDAHDARLDVLAEKCDRLLERRQSAIVTQRRTLTLPVDEPDVPSYVYHSVDVDPTYPVLATLADCTETIDALRTEVRSALDRQRGGRTGSRP
jgi:hypothetical protein